MICVIAVKTKQWGNSIGIIIPKEVARKFRLRKGAYLGVQVLEDSIRLVPIPRDQAWFWTDEWQAKEREADADIAAGRVSPIYDDVEDLIRDLRQGE